MLLSYWRSYSEAGRVIVCAAVAAVALAWIAVHGSYYGHQDHQQEQADADARRLNNPGLYEPHCDEPQDREEADLCAQRDMAEAARDLYRLTWIQIVIGAIGMGAILLTLRETRRAANAAIQAAESAKRAADVERGFVFVRPRMQWGSRQKPEFAAYGHISCNVSVLGRSPVILRTFEYDHRALSKGIEPDNTKAMPITFFAGGKVVRPEDDDVWRPTNQRTDDFGVDEWTAIGQGRVFYWVFGCMTYEDVYGATRHTRFRWAYNGLSGSFEPYGDKPYNERT